MILNQCKVFSCSTCDDVCVMSIPSGGNDLMQGFGKCGSDNNDENDRYYNGMKIFSP